MKKTILIISSIIVITALFTGCNPKGTNPDDIKCFYNNSEYVLKDNNNRTANSTWKIPKNAKTRSGKIFFGVPDDNKHKPNKKATVYNDFDLQMFLTYRDTLYCKKDYNFPDYKDITKIEKIIISTDDSSYSESSSDVVINDKSDIKAIINKFTEASNPQNKSKWVEEKPQSHDAIIEIKFSEIGAIYEYGYISFDVNGNFGFTGLDSNNENALYPLGKVTDILNKYGNWFNECDNN